MKTEIYQVEIPKVLAELVGPQNVRLQITTAVQEIFEGWAKESLLTRIKVTKPQIRSLKKEAADEL